MKTFIPVKEIEEKKKYLIELLAKRENLREANFKLARKIKLLNDKMFRENHKEQPDMAKIDFCNDSLAPLLTERDELKAEIKAVTNEITKIKHNVRYYNSIDTLDTTPAESGFCYQAFGKRRSDLTVEETKEYNRKYYEQVLKERRKLKKKMGG